MSSTLELAIGDVWVTVTDDLRRPRYFETRTEAITWAKEHAPTLEARSFERTYRWVIAIEVAAKWVADGFDFTEENVGDRIREMLPHATEYEITAEVIEAPPINEVRKEQGYRD